MICEHSLGSCIEQPLSAGERWERKKIIDSKWKLHRSIKYEKKRKVKLTWIVFLKFFGSSWSSKGYAPTSITYSVTPHDHTSAIYNRTTPNWKTATWERHSISHHNDENKDTTKRSTTMFYNINGPVLWLGKHNLANFRTTYA